MGGRKSYTPLLVALAILFMQITSSSFVFATGKDVTKPEHGKTLFETKDTLIINNAIELPANTLVYGETTAEDTTIVTVQFNNKEIPVEASKLKEVSMTEGIPDYEEYPTEESKEWSEKKKGDLLFSSVESSVTEIKVLTDFRHPMLQTDSELNYILIGNTRFFLDKETQEKYFTEDETNKEKPAEETVQEENSENTEDDSEVKDEMQDDAPEIGRAHV